MTDVNSLEVAAIPTAIAILTAIQQFKNDLGSDPLKLPLTAGPALLKFTANVELAAPSLLTSEWAAVGTMLDSKVSSWISSLNAKLVPSAAPTPPVTPA